MNFFQRIFHRPQPPQTQPAVMMTAVPYFTPFSGNAYESAVYRAPVEAIARQLAKLKASHVIKLDGGRQPGDAVLNQLLQVRWNPYMSAHDALCKMATLLYLYNNAFAYLQRDDTGNVIAIYPLNTTSMEFLDDGTGTLYCRFYFPNGQNYILPYSDIVHLRRHFHENDLLGDPNTAILPTLQLAQTQDEGITAGIKQGATIRGILKYNQVVAPEILEKERQAFMANYLSIGNTGGLAALDAKYGFTPLESNLMMNLLHVLPVVYDSRLVEHNRPAFKGFRAANRFGGTYFKVTNFLHFLQLLGIDSLCRTVPCSAFASVFHPLRRQ